MARVGKIAQLPAEIRAELNHRLDDGALGNVLLPWLNSLPEVQKLCADRFGGAPITASNLSDWRLGGYAEWQEKSDGIYATKRRALIAMELAKAAGGNLTEGAAAMLAGQFFSVIEARPDTSVEDLLKLTEAIAQLRRGDHSRIALDQANAKIAQASRDLDRKEVELRNTMHRSIEMLLNAANDARVREVADSEQDYSAKVEALGQMMFGPDWRKLPET